MGLRDLDGPKPRELRESQIDSIEQQHTVQLWGVACLAATAQYLRVLRHDRPKKDRIVDAGIRGGDLLCLCRIEDKTGKDMDHDEEESRQVSDLKFGAWFAAA